MYEKLRVESAMQTANKQEAVPSCLPVYIQEHLRSSKAIELTHARDIHWMYCPAEWRQSENSKEITYVVSHHPAGYENLNGVYVFHYFTDP